MRVGECEVVDEILMNFGHGPLELLFIVAVIAGSGVVIIVGGGGEMERRGWSMSMNLQLLSE